MCNLYKTRKSVEEIARLFNADIAPDLLAANLAEEVFPGLPGLVVRERDAGRVVERMIWGWPLVTRDMKERAAATGKDPRPKPVNNARDVTSGFWRSAAINPARRCLIPVETFAEAEGPKGGKTRTWFSVANEAMFAWAGLWRPSVEWGAVYAGVMTEANCLIEPVHDRMPVILGKGNHDRWLRGSFEDLLALQQPCPAERLVMERTTVPWNIR
jgi:putative SOS response-associated peptidase YedK